MSSIQNKPFTFKTALVLKGRNKGEFKKVGKQMVRQNPELEPIRRFEAGTVVDATYMGGRGGSSISFVSDGGRLPDGTIYQGEVTYGMRTTMDGLALEQDPKIVLPKTAALKTEVAEVVVENKSMSHLTTGIIALGVLAAGYGIYKYSK